MSTTSNINVTRWINVPASFTNSLLYQALFTTCIIMPPVLWSSSIQAETTLISVTGSSGQNGTNASGTTAGTGGAGADGVITSNRGNGGSGLYGYPGSAGGSFLLW